MLGSLIIYLKGMRGMMFQFSGFYYIPKCAGRTPGTPNLELVNPTMLTTAARTVRSPPTFRFRV